MKVRTSTIIRMRASGTQGGFIQGFSLFLFNGAFECFKIKPLFSLIEKNQSLNFCNQ